MICRQCGQKLGLMERWRHGQFCSSACKSAFEQEDVQLAIQALASVVRPSAATPMPAKVVKEVQQPDPPMAAFLHQDDPSYEDQPTHAPKTKAQPRPKKRDAILVPDHRFGSPSPNEPRRLALALWIDLSGVPEDATFGCLFPPKVPVYTPERKPIETTLRLPEPGPVSPEARDNAEQSPAARIPDLEPADWNSPSCLPTHAYGQPPCNPLDGELQAIERMEPRVSAELAGMVTAPDDEIEWGGGPEIPPLAVKLIPFEMPRSKESRRELPPALNRWIESAPPPQTQPPQPVPMPAPASPAGVYVPPAAMPGAPAAFPSMPMPNIQVGTVPYVAMPYPMVAASPFGVPLAAGMPYGYPAMTFIPPRAGHMVRVDPPVCPALPRTPASAPEPFPSFVAGVTLPHQAEAGLDDAPLLDLEPTAASAVLSRRPVEVQAISMAPPPLLPRFDASPPKPGFGRRPHRGTIRLRWLEPESLRIPPRAGNSS